MMDLTIPVELLELKTRFDQWRQTRQYVREPIPLELRRATLKISRRFPPSLVRRVLKTDPWRLKRAAREKPARDTARKKSQLAFFNLPVEAASPTPPSPIRNPTDSRLQLERPDGSRLTITQPALDLHLTRQFCEDFLRAGTR
jgi:hypothetical protein